LFILVPPSKTHLREIFAFTELQNALADSNDHLLFLHAMSLWDRMCVPCRKGKVQVFKTMNAFLSFRQKVAVFNHVDSTKDEMVEAGKEFFVAL
jgi:hypothetical protein